MYLIDILLLLSIYCFVFCIGYWVYLHFTRPICDQGHTMYAVWDSEKKNRDGKKFWVHGNYCFECDVFRSDGKVHIQEDYKGVKK